MTITRRFTEEQYELAIDEMQGMRKYVDDFLIDGADVTGLLCLFMARGLPLNNRTARDDGLADSYYQQRDLLRHAFEVFCHEKQTGQLQTRVDRFIDHYYDNHRMDAA